MLCLQGRDIYLAALERPDCKTLWNDFEYDFSCPAEELNIGHSHEKSEDWFEEIQKLQGKTNVRLGIYLLNGTVIGDVALQDIDFKNRTCTMGMGIAKIANRSKGYGQQAAVMMLKYGFENLGMERITANTLEINLPAVGSLKKSGFVLEGTERKAVYLNGNRYDRLCFGMLKEEYIQKFHNGTAKEFL